MCRPLEWFSTVGQGSICWGPDPPDCKFQTKEQQGGIHIGCKGGIGMVGASGLTIFRWLTEVVGTKIQLCMRHPKEAEEDKLVCQSDSRKNRLSKEKGRMITYCNILEEIAKDRSMCCSSSTTRGDFQIFPRFNKSSSKGFPEGITTYGGSPGGRLSVYGRRILEDASLPRLQQQQSCW